MQENQAIVYRDRLSEFNKLDNSLGEIVVIDALSGYGKTAFLKESARLHQTRNWLTQYIPLSQRMRPVDIWTTTVQELSGNYDLHPQRLDDALARLSYALPHGRCLTVLFDDVHSLPSETFTWVYSEFAPKLKEELISISQGNCLLVFSGQNIRVDPKLWPPHRPIYLLPFDRSTIQQFVDAVPSPQLQEFLKSGRHKKWLIEKMIRLCGGHPRALLQILQEIETGAWCPHPRLSEESNRAVFERHIETELNQLIGHLSDAYRQILESLSIFRSVNSNIVKVIQRDEHIQNRDNPLAIISHLRNNNLLIPKETVLDPVIRNGLTTRMILNDRQRYLALNRIAQLSYQTWLIRFDEERPFEEARGYAAEAIYHCLCHSNQLQDLQDCLNIVLQRLDELLAAQSAVGFDSIRALIEYLPDDEDISILFADYGWSIEQLRDMNRVRLANSTSPSSSSSQSDVCDYTSGIVAVLSLDQAVIGTGFLIWCREQWLIVTCTHVLQKLSLNSNSTVHLSHFNPDIGEFEAQVVKFAPPEKPPHQWSAYEDVSILRPTQPLGGDTLKPYPLHNGHLQPSLYPHGQQSLCFGYAQDRINRGDYISDLTFAHEVASGFIALSNRSGRGVRPGVSGAPWANLDTQSIVGMVQSIAANGDQAYLIPASTIGRVISEVLS
jgi:hypothetical protein